MSLVSILKSSNLSSVCTWIQSSHLVNMIGDLSEFVKLQLAQSRETEVVYEN